MEVATGLAAAAVWAGSIVAWFILTPAVWIAILAVWFSLTAAVWIGLLAVWFSLLGGMFNGRHFGQGEASWILPLILLGASLTGAATHVTSLLIKKLGGNLVAYAQSRRPLPRF